MIHDEMAIRRYGVQTVAGSNRAGRNSLQVFAGEPGHMAPALLLTQRPQGSKDQLRVSHLSAEPV